MKSGSFGSSPVLGHGTNKSETLLHQPKDTKSHNAAWKEISIKEALADPSN